MKLVTPLSETPAARPPRVLDSGSALREVVRQAQAAGLRVGLVPTMGALHDGHLQMIEACCRECDLTVVTIFVNPKQFGPGEDWNQYPRDLDRDLALLTARGVDIVFAPTIEEVFPPGHETYVEPGGAAESMEGAMRPHHFRGVATVVLKLFQLAPADVAYFGRKDYQQTLVVEQLIRDLDIPIQMRIFPTVRERDGLALSSRNELLTPAERQQALCIPRSLELAQSMVDSGTRRSQEVAQRVRDVMEAAGADVDYVTLVRDGSVEPVETIREPTVLAIAARIGATRLIDNRLLTPPEMDGVPATLE